MVNPTNVDPKAKTARFGMLRENGLWDERRIPQHVRMQSSADLTDAMHPRIAQLPLPTVLSPKVPADELQEGPRTARQPQIVLAGRCAVTVKRQLQLRRPLQRFKALAHAIGEHARASAAPPSTAASGKLLFLVGVEHETVGLLDTDRAYAGMAFRGERLLVRQAGIDSHRPGIRRWRGC